MRLICLTFVCIFSILCWAGDKVPPSILVQHASEVSDIRGPGAPPFHLKAKVRTYGDTQDEAAYDLVWVNPDRWREEISISDEKAIRIGGAETISVKNDNLNARIIRTHIRKLNIPITLTLRSQEFLGAGVKNQKRNGVALQCATRKGKYTFRAELCFEPEKGILAVENYALPGQEGSEVFFLSYMDFGGKLFPVRVKTYFSGALKTDVEVLSLDRLAQSNAPSIDGATGYTTMPGCETPVLPYAIEQPPPIYHPNAIEEPTPKNVRLSILVDQDGTVRNPKAIQPAASDRSAINAVGKWKFSPAMCGTQPVPLSINVEAYFQRQ